MSLLLVKSSSYILAPLFWVVEEPGRLSDFHQTSNLHLIRITQIDFSILVIMVDKARSS